MVNLGWILLLYSPEMVIAVIEIRGVSPSPERSRNDPHLKEDAPQRSLRGGRAEAQDVLGKDPAGAEADWPLPHDFNGHFRNPKLELPTIYKAYFLGLNLRKYSPKICPLEYGTNVPPF